MSSYMPTFSKYLQEGLSESEERRLLSELTEHITHELTHLEEQTSEWTHNEEFYKKQKKLLRAALSMSDNIYSELERVRDTYTGSFVEPSEFSSYLISLV